MPDRFEPLVVGFLCTWCSYRAADQAGMARTSGVSNLRSIRVPCSGRVEPEFVLGALRQGAHGVLVVGCHQGSCHYVDGNLKAKRRLALLRKLATELGIEGERIEACWVSAAEGSRLANLSETFCDRLRELGPLPRGGANPRGPLLAGAETELP